MHGDREVFEFYQRSWGELIGKFCLDRQRLALLTSIKLGQFFRQVQQYAAMRTSLNLGGLDLSLPLSQEVVPFVQQLRMKLCHIKNDLLEKLADQLPSRPNIVRQTMPYISHDDKWAQVTWRRQKDH